MKRITLINQDSGYLMIDIANDYVRKGYDTTLMAGRIVERDIPLSKEVRVQKIVRYNRSSNLKRLMTWFAAAIQIWVIVLTKFRTSHLLIVSNPPMAPLLPLLLPNKFSLLIFDLFPDALAEYGFVRENSPIVKLWSRANKKVYGQATKIYTLTQGMRKAMTKYVDEHNINVVPLWTSNAFLKPVPPHENPFIREHGLQGKFVVLYSGNFGYTHQVDLLIDLAAGIHNDHIRFVLIGGGRSEQALRQRIVREKITNCLLLPWQDVNILPHSLSSAHLSVVSLSAKADGLAIPSKVFNYMSVGSPILGITSKQSDLAALIDAYGMGRSFTPDEVQEMLSFIEELAADRALAESYSRKALAATKYHSVKNVEQITQFDV